MIAANDRFTMQSKPRKGQRRSREDPVPVPFLDDDKPKPRASALKPSSKKWTSSASSESSDSKLSGATGFDTEFDVDKHRHYDVANSRRRYEELSIRNCSSHDGSADESNMTEEQRAWAGIDAILDDNESVNPETENVLSQEIMAALQRTPNSADEEDYDDDYDDDSEDSHDEKMKMFCGGGLKLGDSAAYDELPNLMDSSFSSQFSQESARSIFSYLSKNNIIVQRDIQDGPLKSFLTDMACNLEQGKPIEEGHENQDVDDVDDDTEIHLIEDAKVNSNQKGDTKETGDGEEDVVSLDPIGQQIINAIMTEMQRMKESDEYDEDDDVDDQYYDDEYDEVEVEESCDEEVYDEQEEDEEREVERSPTRSPTTSPINMGRAPAQKIKQEVAIQNLPDIKDRSFVEEEDLNNSIPSLDTFQDDEVNKILVHQNPMAWASFGDLHFDSNHAQPRELPKTPLYEEESEGQPSPFSPIRSVRDEIVSGIVSPPISRKEAPSPPPPSSSKPKRQPVAKTQMKKKKKPQGAGETAARRQSVVRVDSGCPTGEMRQSTARTKTPKLMRKSMAGAAPTPKMVRKSIKRTEPTAGTPKVMRKSVARPDVTPAVTPCTTRRSVSSLSTPRQTPGQGRKLPARQCSKRGPAVKEGTAARNPEGDKNMRRSVARKGRPNPGLGASQSEPRNQASAGDPPSGPQSPSRKKKMIKGTSLESAKLQNLVFFS